MANQSAKYRKRGGSGVEGVESAFTRGASLVGGKRKARGKRGRTQRKSRRGGFLGKAALPLALVAAQQYASKRRGNVLPVRLARHIVKGTRRGLGAVKRSVGKATRRISRPFTRKMSRSTRRR